MNTDGLGYGPRDRYVSGDGRYGDDGLGAGPGIGYGDDGLANDCEPRAAAGSGKYQDIPTPAEVEPLNQYGKSTHEKDPQIIPAGQRHSSAY
jgi:hypothetical protein